MNKEDTGFLELLIFRPIPRKYKKIKLNRLNISELSKLPNAPDELKPQNYYKTAKYYGIDVNFDGYNDIIIIRYHGNGERILVRSGSQWDIRFGHPPGGAGC